MRNLDNFDLPTGNEFEEMLIDTPVDKILNGNIPEEMSWYIIKDILDHKKKEEINDHIKTCILNKKYNPYKSTTGTLTRSKAKKLFNLYEEKNITLKELCKLYSINESYIYKYLSLKKDKYCIPTVKQPTHRVKPSKFLH
jgi:hypothetical protein